MSRSLDELVRRKKDLGNLGALDFLIQIERQKFETPNEDHKITEILSLATESDKTPSLVNALADSLLLNQKLTAETKHLSNEKARLLEKCHAQEQAIQERFQELAILSRMLMNQNDNVSE